MLIQPDGVAVELPPEARKLSMGFHIDSTKAPTVTALQRNQAPGNCIDLNLATSFVGAILEAPKRSAQISLYTRARHLPPPSPQPALPAVAVHASTLREELQAISSRPCIVCGLAEGEDNMVFCDGCNQLYHLRCLVPPRSTVPSGAFYCPSCDPTGLTSLDELYNPDTALVYRLRDPYLDPWLLFFLVNDAFPDDEPISAQQRSAVRRLAKRYRAHPVMPGWVQYLGRAHHHWRTVPPVEFRLDIIRSYHDAMGHLQPCDSAGPLRWFHVARSSPRCV